jgi:prolyl oligopeptidase
VDTVVDTMHGAAIPDPYRWLEARNSPETRAWLAEQRTYAESIIRRTAGRTYLENRLRSLMDHDEVGAPQRAGEYEYFMMRRAGEEIAGIYRRPAPKPGDAQPIDPQGEYETVIDPRPWTSDQTRSVGIAALSPDGALMAYTVREGGADEVEVRIRDLARGTDLADRFPPAVYGSMWFGDDGASVSYTHWSSSIGPRFMVHKLGADVATDSVVFGPTGPHTFLSVSRAEAGRYLIYTVNHGWVRSEILVQDTRRGGATRAIVHGLDARFEARYLGGELYLRTNYQADKYRVVAVRLDQPERSRWREVIPEGEHLLEDFALIGDKFYVTYLENFSNRIRILEKDGSPAGEIAIPDFHAASIRGGRPGEAFLTLTSFTTPTTVYRLDLATGGRTVWTPPPVVWDTSGLVVRAVWYTSRDGTRGPLLVMHRGDVALDGRPFALLTAYGGFGVARKPRFEPATAAWVELGGVFALATVRGGGELGERWHRGGILQNKQNGFDDFIAAAEWLIANKHTSAARLVSYGVGNGGLLVGAALTQRPDLFQAVVCGVPDLDILRAYTLRSSTNVPAVLEYGDPRNPSHFETIRRYSPYQNVKANTAYPAVMFFTGDLDTRIPPFAARKMTARLQAATTSGRPVVLWYNPRMGHGGRPMSRLVLDGAAQLAFALDQVGVDLHRRSSDREDGLPEHVHPRRHPQPRHSRRRQPPAPPLRRPLGDRDRHVAVEVGGREQQRRRRRVREVRDRGRHDVATPGVLDRHRDAEGDADIADLPRPGEPTNLRDLEVDHVHRLIGRGAHHHVEIVHDLVQHERPVRVPADGQTLVIGEAGLLEVHVHVTHRVRHPDGRVLGPSGIGIGHEQVGRGQGFAHRLDPRDVRIGIAAHLELELGVALLAVPGHLLGHPLGGLL